MDFVFVEKMLKYGVFLNTKKLHGVSIHTIQVKKKKRSNLVRLDIK